MKQVITKRIFSDRVYLLFLLFSALTIGLAIQFTTVIICKDGVTYIQLARDFLHHPLDVIQNSLPFGYPFLISLTYQIFRFFSGDNSLFQWIAAAQSTSLVCRILSLIPLYYFGKKLVGPRDSFYGLLLFIFLPYPAMYGSDVLRDWPHLLFLATGMSLLIHYAHSLRWTPFLAIGITTGLGYLIRPECFQVLLYGMLWLICILYRRQVKVSTVSVYCTMAALIGGFLIPAVPYHKINGSILPPKLMNTIESLANSTVQEETACERDGCAGPKTASVRPIKFLKAMGEIAKRMAENLVYFLMFPWGLGLYAYLRNKRCRIHSASFFVWMLVSLNLLLLLLLYFQYHYITRRHCLPLLAFTIFFIPVGFRLLARRLAAVGVCVTDKLHQSRQRLVWIMAVTGIVFCIGKSIRTFPMNKDKLGFFKTASWLRENTSPNDVIACSSWVSPRFEFYAERDIQRIGLRSCKLTSGKLEENTWIHLVGTYDGILQELYVDGNRCSFCNPGFSGLHAGQGVFVIGQPFLHSDQMYQGKVTDVQLYQRALSPEDVNSLFLGQRLSLEAEMPLIVGWSAESTDKPLTSPVVFGQIESPAEQEVNDFSIAPEAFTISLRIQPERSAGPNWILGNGGQFRVGVVEQKVQFWIQEKKPGTGLPPDTSYLLILENHRFDKQLLRDKTLLMCFSIPVDDGGEREIAVYRVIRNDNR